MRGWGPHVVVVVPALPQRGQGEPEVVACVAVRVELAAEAPRPHHVRQGVDAVPGTASRGTLHSERHVGLGPPHGPPRRKHPQREEGRAGWGKRGGLGAHVKCQQATVDTMKPHPRAGTPSPPPASPAPAPAGAPSGNLQGTPQAHRQHSHPTMPAGRQRSQGGLQGAPPSPGGRGQACNGDRQLCKVPTGADRTHVPGCP